jgi:hypothetical protein
LANSHCCCHQQDKSPGLYGHGIWQKYGLECNVQKNYVGIKSTVLWLRTFMTNSLSRNSLHPIRRSYTFSLFNSENKVERLMFSAMLLQTPVFWHVTPCQLANPRLLLSSENKLLEIKLWYSSIILLHDYATGRRLCFSATLICESIS